MSISDHRPHIPWGGVVGVIRRHHDDGEPTVTLAPIDDSSIHEWLASGDRTPTAAELPPAQIPTGAALTSLRMPTQVQTTPVDLPTMPLYLEAARVSVARVPSALEVTQAGIAQHRETVQHRADLMARVNDARLERLLGRSRGFGEYWRGAASALEVGWLNTAELLKRVLVTKRRRERISPLVPELGHLLAAGDVDQATAAHIMSMRSRYLSAVDDDSQRLERLTPEVLDRLDRTLGLRTPQAPQQGSKAVA